MTASTNTSYNTLVASSHGDIVTYAEHCPRLDAYLEEIMSQARELTAGNKSLSTPSPSPGWRRVKALCTNFVLLTSPLCQI